MSEKQKHEAKFCQLFLRWQYQDLVEQSLTQSNKKKL